MSAWAARSTRWGCTAPRPLRSFCRRCAFLRENLLGEIGKGHKVAFSVLNYGRFKLGAMTIGGAKAAIGEAVTTAAGRKQFGQAIAILAPSSTRLD